MAYIDDKLGRGERVIYTAHQHPILLVVRAIKWIGLFLVAFILAVWVGLAWTPASGDWLNGAKTVVILALVIIAVVSFVAMFLAYLVWQNEEFVITNERLVKVEGIINKSLSDSSLEKINDVEMFQTLWGRMFGYGTIRIVTGNESGANTFNYLGNPNEFKRAMLDAKNGFYGDASDVARAQRSGQQQYRAPEAEYRPAPAPAPRPAQPAYREEQPPYYAAKGQPEYRGGDGYASQYQQQQGNPGPAQADIPAMIAQLAKLRDQGAITEAEFQAKKNDLLRRL